MRTRERGSTSEAATAGVCWFFGGMAAVILGGWFLVLVAEALAPSGAGLGSSRWTTSVVRSVQDVHFVLWVGIVLGVGATLLTSWVTRLCWRRSRMEFRYAVQSMRDERAELQGNGWSRDLTEYAALGLWRRVVIGVLGAVLGCGFAAGVVGLTLATLVMAAGTARVGQTPGGGWIQAFMVCSGCGVASYFVVGLGADHVPAAVVWIGRWWRALLHGERAVQVAPRPAFALARALSGGSASSRN